MTFDFLVRDTIVVINIKTTATWGGKGSSGLAFIPLFIIEEVRTEFRQGKNLDAGTESEAMVGCCLLGCSSWPAQPAFL